MGYERRTKSGAKLKAKPKTKQRVLRLRAIRPRYAQDDTLCGVTSFIEEQLFFGGFLQDGGGVDAGGHFRQDSHLHVDGTNEFANGG